MLKCFLWPPGEVQDSLSCSQTRFSALASQCQRRKDPPTHTSGPAAFLILGSGHGCEAALWGLDVQQHLWLRPSPNQPKASPPIIAKCPSGAEPSPHPAAGSRAPQHSAPESSGWLFSASCSLAIYFLRSPLVVELCKVLILFVLRLARLNPRLLVLFLLGAQTPRPRHSPGALSFAVVQRASLHTCPSAFLPSTGDKPGSRNAAPAEAPRTMERRGCTVGWGAWAGPLLAGGGGGAPPGGPRCSRRPPSSFSSALLHATYELRFKYKPSAVPEKQEA